MLLLISSFVFSFHCADGDYAEDDFLEIVLGLSQTVVSVRKGREGHLVVLLARITQSVSALRLKNITHTSQSLSLS